MKPILTIIIFLCCLLQAGYSQHIPLGMKYQAVARDEKGQIFAERDLQLKISLYSNIDQKKVAYGEIHKVITNQLGLFSLTIGEGIKYTGEFKDIPWSTNDIWMEVAIQTDDETDFVTISSSKMLSVPYAFHAATASELVGGSNDGRGGTTDAVTYWAVKGNLHTDPMRDRLGTADGKDLVIVTSNLERMRILANGNIHIKNSVEIDGDLLDVAGSVELNSKGGETVNHGDFTVDDQSSTHLTGTLRADGQTWISNDTESTDWDNGALVVDGGAGIGRNLNVGGDLNVQGETSFGGTATFGGQLHITDLTQSTSPTTGALVVDGGVGIGKRLNVREGTILESTLGVNGLTKLNANLDVYGLAVMKNTAQSNTKDDGSLVIEGGVGIEKNLNVGGTFGVKGSSQSFMMGIENTNGSGGDGLVIKLGKTHPAWDGDEYLNVTNPSVEIFDNAIATVEGWIDGVPFEASDLLDFWPNAYIAGTICNLINIITDKINEELGLPAGIDGFQITPPIQIFPGIDLGILGSIPALTVPAINFPTIPVIPEIPDVNCDGLPSFSMPNISLTDVSNSLDNENQFISFKDKDNRELGSVRAESVSDWRGRFFSGAYFTDLLCEVVGIDILSGIAGAVNKFTEIATAHNEMGVEYASGHGDYAEWLERIDPSENINSGDIIAVKGGKITKDLSVAEQIMAVSSKPIVLGNTPSAEKEPYGNKIAFMGQIPVKVMGPVTAGDYIVGNVQTPGYGIAVKPEFITAEQANLTVGRSWDTNLNSGPKMVNTVVGVDNSKFVHLFQNKQKEIDNLDARVKELEAKMNDIVTGLQKFQVDVVEMNKQNAERMAENQRMIEERQKKMIKN